MDINFNIITDLFALGIFTLLVSIAIFTKEDAKETNYLLWALVVLLANLFDNILRVS